MIKITISEKEKHIDVSCIGHAYYDTVGQDIVCAAISTLFQTLCYSLEELTNEKINVSLESGYSHLTVYKPSRYGKLLIHSFYIGCREISNMYSDYVQIIED